MEENQNFNQSVRLAELAAKRFDSRRSFEWKIVLGFWFVMLATFSRDWRSPEICGGWLILAVALFTITWIRGVWTANQNDKRRYEYFFSKAEIEVGENRDPGEYPESLNCCQSWGFFCDWNSQFQMLVTAAIAAIYYIGQRH